MSIEAVSDSFQLLIGLLLYCCFPAVFSIKTAGQQQPGKKDVGTLCLECGVAIRGKIQNK
jgi:hypothetical protein